MTPKSEAFKKEHHRSPPHPGRNIGKMNLESLGIEQKTGENNDDLNDKTELEALAEIIKQIYYRDHKTAYDDSSDNNNSKI
jgi:hypothetical protein